MFKLQIPSLGRGAIHTTLIAVAAAAVGAVLSATVTHSGAMTEASTSREIAPIDPTCTSSLPCIEYVNQGTGFGIEGFGKKGSGLAGVTQLNSTSPSSGKAGVLGVDQSASGTFDSGIMGVSTRGTGVLGTSTSGTGITAQSTNGFGLIANSVLQVGVFGRSSRNDGVDGVTSSPSLTAFGRYGVLGGDNSTDGGRLNRGVEGISTKGVGVEGFSSAGVGVNAIGGANIGGNFLPALSVVVNGLGDLIDACPTGTASPCDEVNSVF